MKKTITLGLITDLHQDIVCDGPQRLDAFLRKMRSVRPDALVQLGDFAIPAPQNQALVTRFNQAHRVALHVLGNHDTDGGYTKAQTMAFWQMPQRYYTRDLDGLRLIVLDGNDTGSPTHKGGYPIYVGPEQVAWLRAQLKSAPGPMLVLSHQPLAGPTAVDNAAEVQQVLGEFAEKVLLAINGHTHLDTLVRVQNVCYLHLNSASYYWVGGSYKHLSYPPEVHAKFPTVTSTCPYQKPLFSTLRVDLETGKVTLEKCEGQWQGKSPGELGALHNVALADGGEIIPAIRERQLYRRQN